MNYELASKACASLGTRQRRRHLVTTFEDRLLRIARETMEELGRDPDEITDVEEPPGADFAIIHFRDDSIQPIEVPRAMGAGDTQEQDEVRRALQYRFRT
jgi:hypothetical protein